MELLPRDVIYYLFNFLDSISIIKFQETCKYYKNLDTKKIIYQLHNHEFKLNRLHKLEEIIKTHELFQDLENLGY